MQNHASRDIHRLKHNSRTAPNWQGPHHPGWGRPPPPRLARPGLSSRLWSLAGRPPPPYPPRASLRKSWWVAWPTTLSAGPPVHAAEFHETAGPDDDSPAGQLWRCGESGQLLPKPETVIVKKGPGT
jgi:hypothetical protein